MVIDLLDLKMKKLKTLLNRKKKVLLKKPVLILKKHITFHVNADDFNTFLKKVYNIDFKFYETSRWWFGDKEIRVSKGTIHEYEINSLNKFKIKYYMINNLNSYHFLELILKDLCNHNLIEEGDYIFTYSVSNL